MAPQEPKSRKPANTAFKQQRLKAWQPILTPRTVLPTFFIVGIIFAPLGGLLLYLSDSVSELNIDYTNCLNADTSFSEIPSKYVASSFAQSNSTPILAPQWKFNTANVPYVNGTVSLDGNDPNGFTLPTNQCTIQFTVQSTLKHPVLFYYRLTNFYQNHRRYVKSFDQQQLQGSAVGLGGLTACSPLEADSNDTIYYPCGLIANSLFNDTIYQPTFVTDNTTYNFEETGIAWPSDLKRYGETQYQYDQIVPPPNWALRWPNGKYDNKNGPINLAEDEHFQVWMRTAGLPDFRKLYGKNTQDDMPDGTYQIVIDYNFPVTQYGGTKSLVISTVSFLGGKNPFLGIAYIAVGIVCVVLGCLFTARHLYKPRKLGDHTYLSWNQNNPPVGSHRD